MKDNVFRQIRFSLYLAFFLNGLVQLIVPFQYRCNITSEECFACGLRTAITLFLQGRFSEAYQSNKLIVVLVVAAIVMTADVFVYWGKALVQRKNGDVEQQYGGKDRGDLSQSGRKGQVGT